LEQISEKLLDSPLSVVSAGGLGSEDLGDMVSNVTLSTLLRPPTRFNSAVLKVTTPRGVVSLVGLDETGEGALSLFSVGSVAITSEEGFSRLSRFVDSAFSGISVDSTRFESTRGDFGPSSSSSNTPSP